MNEDEIDTLRAEAEAEENARIEDVLISEEDAVHQAQAPTPDPKQAQKADAMMAMLGAVPSMIFNAIAKRKRWAPLEPSEDAALTEATADLAGYYIKAPEGVMGAWIMFGGTIAALALPRMELEEKTVDAEAEDVTDQIHTVTSQDGQTEDPEAVPPLTAPQTPAEAARG